MRLCRRLLEAKFVLVGHRYRDVLAGEQSMGIHCSLHRVGYPFD